MNLNHAPINEQIAALKSKKLSAVELTQSYLDRIDRLDPLLNAFITKDESALEQAKVIDSRIAKGDTEGLLFGIPVALKDLLCTKNLRTTAGSKILENFVPPYDATIVKKLRQAGSIVLGKLNLDEFAMGSSNETSYFGPTKNPWSLEHTTGGSSGGSAAAQASRLAAFTIGTDTGGSIRQPASFCGVVGVKPTYGRVSRYGIIAYASSLDQAGPMTSDVTDAALVLEVISGHDSMDATSSQKKAPSFSAQLNKNMKGVRVGLIKEFMSDGLSAETRQTLIDATKALRESGAEIVELSLPLTEMSIPTYYLIASSEASSNLARYDGVKYGYRADVGKLSSVSLEEFYSQTRGQGFGSEVKRRIMLGTYCLSSGYYEAYYNKSCQVRRLLQSQFHEAFKKCDVMLSPVTTAPAFRLGERITDPLSMYLNDIFTVSTNLAGIPGMSLPYSLSESGLPIGVQIQANAFEEQKMLNVAFALEESSKVLGKKPHVI